MTNKLIISNVCSLEHDLVFQQVEDLAHATA